MKMAQKMKHERPMATQIHQYDQMLLQQTLQVISTGVPKEVGQYPQALQQRCQQFCAMQLELIRSQNSVNILSIHHAGLNSDIFIMSNMINLIDEHGKFNELLREYPTSTANIAIFGSQSSGKSTLINSAFQTHFPVLDSLEGRKRCTKGVWFENNGKFNIIDTEGFDSVEREKNQRIIQRQIALFCLAVADVIIVNIWMNEIGRYQGGQVHILKAILKAANYLLESQSKTLLFVVKDCSRDADHEVLRFELQNQISKVMAENPSKGAKSLKFNIEYYFMSHFIYHPQEYQKQASRLSSMIKVRKSSMSQHEPKDRVIYLHHLWDTIIANDGDIDLRIEEEAIRSYVVNRIRDEVKDTIEKLVTAETAVGKRSSYERFYEFYVKKGFEQVKSKLPKYVDEKTIKTQFFLLEQSLQYVIQKHFTEVILPKEQAVLLTDCLQKQLQKSYNSIQLEKIITEQRKKVLQLYKFLVQGHKEAPILIKRFAERITQESVNFQRQVSHLFNIFQTKLEMEINKELDRQVKKLKFEGTKVTQKFKTLCKQFQYNEWQVNIKQIWEKATHRILTQKLNQQIEDLSSAQQCSMFAGEQEAIIITYHKNLQKEIESFIQSLLQYFEQDDSTQQYIEKANEKIRNCLQAALLRQRKRFRLSMLILGVFLVFCYGEFMKVLKYAGFKKKTRGYLSILYLTVVFVIVSGSVIKRLLKSQGNHQRVA